MLEPQIRNYLSKNDKSIVYSAVRSQGAGGQNVNKVSTAVELRFEINTSAFPFYAKQKMLSRSDQRLNKEGVLVLFSQESRSQEQNKLNALERLVQWIGECLYVEKPRRETKPTRASKERRLDAKKKASRNKNERQNRNFD